MSPEGNTSTVNSACNTPSPVIRENLHTPNSREYATYESTLSQKGNPAPTLRASQGVNGSLPRVDSEPGLLLVRRSPDGRWLLVAILSFPPRAFVFNQVIDAELFGFWDLIRLAARKLPPRVW
jgi:hypothetical protein